MNIFELLILYYTFIELKLINFLKSIKYNRPPQILINISQPKIIDTHFIGHANRFKMFIALKYHNANSKSVIFKGENHELSHSDKPRHKIKLLKEIC